MTSFITKAATVSAAVSFAVALTVASSAPASAQSALTNGPNGMQPNTLRSNNKGAMPSRRPLTVRRSTVEAPVVAAAPVAPAGIVSAPLAGVGTVVGLPFQVLGGIFPSAGALKGGVTDVPYEGAKAKVAEIDEGWAVAVPVDHSGPTFVVANGDPTVSPLVLIGTPIRAFGTVAQAPLRVIGAGAGGLGL